MYKILIVDDEPLVQVGIKSMINCEKLNVEICGVAGNGETALELIESTSPDIVLCDIKMPRMSGLELIKASNEKYGYGHPVFIFLTSYEDFHMAKEALSQQASDYLIKLELTPELLDESINKAISRIRASAPANDDNNNEELMLTNYYDKFYIRLLQNMFDTPEQFRLQSAFLNITFDADAYQCVYLEFFDNTGNNLSSGKRFALYLSSFNLLKELIIKYFPATVVSLDVKHCVIIIHSQKQNDEITPNSHKLLEIMNILHDSLRKYYNITFKAGIGSIAYTPLDIGNSYQNARQAYTFTDENTHFFSIDECKDIEYNHQIFNISIFRDELSRAFEEFDEVALNDIINQLTDMFLKYPKRHYQALDAACGILYIAISALPNGEQTITDLFADYPEHYRSIYRQHTMEQIVNWLITFKERISKYFSERKNTHTNHTVTLVKRYINEHCTEKLSLNDVATRFNITPNYLSQLFKKFSDIGFNEYINVTKIAEAKRLMAEGNLKIYEISDLIGFESSFYFSKVFKKIEGMSPTEYINSKLQ